LNYENKTATVRRTVTLGLQPASRIHHHQPLQVLLQCPAYSWCKSLYFFIYSFMHSFIHFSFI